jgi:3,4-dihydroxy 2-butanone 4-phosphate synthase/GTP cyclohydrolase II
MSPDCTNSFETPHGQTAAAQAEPRKTVNGEAQEVLDLARRATVPTTRAIPVRQLGKHHVYRVTRYGWGEIPTAYGEFKQLAFRVDDEWRDYHCLVKAERWMSDLQPLFCHPEDLPLRLDSECIGGMIFGATDCDCRAQLLKAEEEIALHGEGLIIHIFGQDGRGKGTGFKCATQILQKRLVYDTVQAARALAHSSDIDVRTYGGAIAVLKFLLGPNLSAGFVLLSGNPRKEAALSENGFSVKLRPPEILPTPETLRHLQAKAHQLAHLVPCLTQ